MDWEEISQLPREQLLVLFHDTLRNLIRLDGYWFLAVEQLAGQEAAVKADESVWQRFGRVEAFQIRRTFEIKADGIPALVHALRSSLLWPLSCDYHVEQTSPIEATFRVFHCNSQAERLKAGLGTFPCRGVEEGYFSAFAHTIDPRIEVTCISCPPDNHPDRLWCQWHFRLEKSDL
jgi:hypothetical protein